MTSDTTTDPLPTAPPDCQHDEWLVGCPRCFYEMKGLAEGTLHTEQQQAQFNGGVLMIWHVMMVTIDMVQQLTPLTRSIDLQRGAVARDVIANLKQVQVYLTRLVMDERRLISAMAAS